jgi:hypothetical protein
MGGTCSTHGRDEKCKNNFWRKREIRTVLGETQAYMEGYY